MGYKATSNATSTLASGLTNVATSLSIQSGDVSKFPVINNGGAGSDYTYLTLQDAAGNIEVVKVTRHDTGAQSNTIQRAQYGTSARTWLAGDIVSLRCPGELIESISDVADSALPKAGGIVSGPLTVSSFLTVGSDLTLGAGAKMVFEGTTDDAFETTLDPGNPTADRTLTLPDKSGTVATVEDSLQNSGGTMTGLLKLKAGTSIASAATVNLSTATGNTVHITGTTGISAFTVTAGQVMEVIFDGVLTLTHHATNNNLPGGANITTAANDRARYFSDGTVVWCLSYTRADGTAVSVVASAALQGAFKNLAISASGTAASIAVSYDELVLGDGSGNCVTERNVSGTITTTATGAGGLDTGALAGSTWYYIYRIGKTDGTRAFLFSLSATAPTMPTGYTMKARIGAFRTDGTANKYPLAFNQYGRRVQYKVASATNVTAMPIMASGTAGNISTPTWVAVGVSNHVPATAIAIDICLQTQGSGAIAAPNNAYSGATSSTNPPHMAIGVITALIKGTMILESTNIYWASAGATGVLACAGWEDTL